jgi:hypothetical protein
MKLRNGKRTVNLIVARLQCVATRPITKSKQQQQQQTEKGVQTTPPPPQQHTGSASSRFFELTTQGQPLLKENTQVLAAGRTNAYDMPGVVMNMYQTMENMVNSTMSAYGFTCKDSTAVQDILAKAVIQCLQPSNST